MLDDHLLARSSGSRPAPRRCARRSTAPGPAARPRGGRTPGRCRWPGTASRPGGAGRPAGRGCRARSTPPAVAAPAASASSRPRCAPSAGRDSWCLYASGSQRRAAAAAHLVGQLDHLVDRLPAVEAHDEVLDGGGQLRVALRRAGLAQHLDHHGDHDLRPALADQRQGAVEVEQHRAEPAARQVWPQDLDLVVRKHHASFR